MITTGVGFFTFLSNTGWRVVLSSLLGILLGFFGDLVGTALAIGFGNILRAYAGM